MMIVPCHGRDVAKDPALFLLTITAVVVYLPLRDIFGMEIIGYHSVFYEHCSHY